MSIFFTLLFAFNIIVTPLAQAIWGTYFIGYKTFREAFLSVFMIAYTKGNLDRLLDINFIWSALFLLLYYFVAFFIVHAAFHQTQFVSLKNIVLLNSLKENDLIEEKKKEVD
jgi:hypothetical protein